MLTHLPLFPKGFDGQLLTKEEQIAHYLLSQLHHYQSELAFPKDKLPIVFSAIFYKKNKGILEAIRRFHRLGLEHLNQVFNEQKLTNDFHQTLDYLYSSLCFLPLWEFHLDKQSSITIPQFIENVWQLIEFEIHSIEITPTVGLESYLVDDCDRAYCYGLIPKKQNAKPILIFSGSTYPIGAGALTYYKADLEAFSSVGELLFKKAKNKLKAWMNQENIQTLNVLGLSLGGAMSLQFSLHFPEKIHQVFALNPPGLYELPDNIDGKPAVRVLIQHNDLVSKFGLWHPDWQIEKVSAPQDFAFQSRTLDHGLIYSGFIKKEYSHVDALQKNQESYLRNLFIFKGLRNFIYIFLMLPTYYLIIPTIRLVSRELLFIVSTVIAYYLGLAVMPALSLAASICECLKGRESKVFQAINQTNITNTMIFIISLLVFTPLMIHSCYLIPLSVYLASILSLMINKCFAKKDASCDPP